MKDIDEKVELRGLDEDYPKPILIKNLGMLYPTEKSKRKRRYGIYKCGFCGNEFKTGIQDINSGDTKSCGCHKKRRSKEANTKHGLSYTRLYNIWTNMKMRVFNPQYIDYQYYGGRGISICEEWKNDFMSFYNWAMFNGYSKDLSIDRIDNDGNYCPENCRWTTKTIQSRNQRKPKSNKSGYKGVYFYKNSKKYVAYISINKKKIYLGYFQTAVEGAIVYNNFIIENNLEGFILNEIPAEYQQ